MKHQLRMYAIKPGEMTEWIDDWGTNVVPLRHQHGFEVVGAWTIDGEDRFVWILRYTGTKPWAEADADYYGSSERQAMTPNPARHIASSETWLMTPAV